MSDTLENQRIEEAFNFLVSQFPSRYNVRGTVYLQALLRALAEGDGFIASQVEAVRDNLLVITASSNHLDRLASQYGVIRGQGAGVQDADFKKLIPVLGMSPKQITHTLQKIIDTIYGPFASHANVTASAPAPYHLNPGSELRLRVDDEEIIIPFQEFNAANLQAATANEIATAISGITRGRVIGSVVTNTRTGEEFVNIRTSTIGSQGFIQVLGGDAQGALRFPQVRNTRQDIATWDIARHLGSSEMTYTATSGISPGLKMANVKVGDIVTIRRDAGFDPANCGSFTVTYVAEDSFRISNGAGIPESSITQQNIDDFVFYRPDLGNILLASRPATVLETGNREITVLLPVTSPIVKRGMFGAHHFHQGLSVLVGATEETAILASANNFSDSGALHVIASRHHNKSTALSVNQNRVTLVSAEGWPESGAVYCPTTQQFYYYSGKDDNDLLGVTPTPPPTITGSTLKYSERFMFTGRDGTTLTGVYPDPRVALGLEVADAGAELIEGYAGSFLYDPEAQFIAAQEDTRLEEIVKQGSSRTVVNVENCSQFPESGHFVLEFGSEEQEGPIRFLGKVGSGALIIDPGYVFDRDHLAGSKLRLVRKVGPYSPRSTGEDLAVYLTSTSTARDLVAQYLRDIIAAGIVIKFNVSVPEQKWALLPQLYSSDPLSDSLV
jgi:hypothetical protein